MIRHLARISVLSVIAVVLAVTGCEPGSDRLPQDPTSPHQLLGTLSSVPQPHGYTLVKDPLLPGITEALSSATLIGVDGGKVSLLGHALRVPAGAVSEPTLFTLTVLPSGYVEVDLGATTTSTLGETLDVGSKGFAKPVAVSLTFSRATNVADPSLLTVLRINSLIGYKKYEVMPSKVDLKGETVNTQLDHFSRYVVAMPN